MNHENVCFSRRAKEIHLLRCSGGSPLDSSVDFQMSSTSSYSSSSPNVVVSTRATDGDAVAAFPLTHEKSSSFFYISPECSPSLRGRSLCESSQRKSIKTTQIQQASPAAATAQFSPPNDESSAMKSHLRINQTFEISGIAAGDLQTLLAAHQEDSFDTAHQLINSPLFTFKPSHLSKHPADNYRVDSLPHQNHHEYTSDYLSDIKNITQPMEAASSTEHLSDSTTPIHSFFKVMLNNNKENIPINSANVFKPPLPASTCSYLQPPPMHSPHSNALRKPPSPLHLDNNQLSSFPRYPSKNRKNLSIHTNTTQLPGTVNTASRRSGCLRINTSTSDSPFNAGGGDYDVSKLLLHTEPSEYNLRSISPMNRRARINRPTSVKGMQAHPHIQHPHPQHQFPLAGSTTMREILARQKSQVKQLKNQSSLSQLKTRQQVASDQSSLSQLKPRQHLVSGQPHRQLPSNSGLTSNNSMTTPTALTLTASSAATTTTAGSSMIRYDAAGEALSILLAGLTANTTTFLESGKFYRTLSRPRVDISTTTSAANHTDQLHTPSNGSRARPSPSSARSQQITFPATDRSGGGVFNHQERWR